MVGIGSDVKAHNSIAMMSSMVGIPQQGEQKKIINKETEEEKPEVELGHREDDEEGLQGSRAHGRGQNEETRGAIRQQTAAVQRRMLGEEPKHKIQTGAGEQQSEEGSVGVRNQGKPLLDNSTQIQLQFMKFQASQRQQAASGAQKQVNHGLQKKLFADKMQKWVDIEYKQYVKQNDPLYSRKSLREVLQALGEFESPSMKESKSNRGKANKSVKMSKYNKYNISKATKAMRIFEEIPSSKDNMNYDLVA